MGPALQRESTIGGGTTNVVDWRAIQRLIAGIVDTFLRKETPLVEDVEQGEAWQHDDCGQPDRDQYDRQGAGGGRGRGDRQALGQQVGPLGHAPGAHDAGHRDDGEQPSASGGVSDEQHERTGAADDAEDHERQRPGGEAVEDVARVRAEHEDTDGRDDRYRDGGGHGPAAEVAGHLGVPCTPDVPDEVDGGQVGHRRHGQDASDDRGRVDPAVDRVAGLAAGWYAARGDAAGDGAHAVGHQHRGDGERSAEDPAFTGGGDHLAEGEADAAQDDAKGRDGEGHEQRQGDRGVGLGERGPQDDEDEDQPDVVGFPHRTDRTFDGGAGAPASLGAARGQVPEPGPEVGAAEDRIGHHGQEQHPGDGGAHRTGSSSAVTGTGGSLGPYGTSCSAGPSARRNRLLIPRSTRIVVVPTTAYRTTTARKVIQTPVLPVAAS